MKDDMIYLASPYSHTDKKVREERLEAVKETCSYLVYQLNLLVYSPIVYGCTVEQMSGGFPKPYSFWMKHCKKMITACNTLIICDHIEGWTSSKGIKQEIQWAQDMNIPIKYYTKLDA